MAVGFVLLDGWKDLYLPVLRLLEPWLAPGALVVADDTVSMADEMTDYLSYVRDPAHGYLSVALRHVVRQEPESVMPGEWPDHPEMTPV